MSKQLVLENNFEASKRLAIYLMKTGYASKEAEIDDLASEILSALEYIECDEPFIFEGGSN